ncbi:MAG: right-handed parallel beta-helix repeat-containing protein, partial [Chthoniobacterales bacterium]
AIAIVSPVWPAHNLIQNCRVSHYAGGWCTAIFFVAKIPESQPSPNEINVMVRNNEVFLDAPDLTRGAEGAYGGGDMQNVIFQNNYSWKATCGFNIDTGTPRNLVMENNTFSNCSGVGITIRAIQSQYYMRNVIIKNNTISLLPIGNVTYGTSIGSDHSPYPDDGTCTDVHITGNTFYCSAPIPKNAAAYSIRVYDLTRLTVVNNSIEKTIPAQLLQGFHDLTLSGNVDLGGNPFPGLQTIPVLPPSKAPVIPLPR